MLRGYMVMFFLGHLRPRPPYSDKDSEKSALQMPAFVGPSRLVRNRFPFPLEQSSEAPERSSFVSPNVISAEVGAFWSPMIVMFAMGR